jgi:hypothetical protein
MRTYGTLLSLFYVPSERLVGRKNNMMPFRSIGTIGELGVLLVVNFVGKLKLLASGGEGVIDPLASGKDRVSQMSIFYLNSPVAIRPPYCRIHLFYRFIIATKFVLHFVKQGI